MGRIRAFLASLLQRVTNHLAPTEEPVSAVKPALAQREPGSVLPDLDPLVVVLRHSGRIVRSAEVGRDFAVRAEVLGTGCSGCVVLGEHRSTGQRVAIKTFFKSKLKNFQLKRLEEEVNVCLQVDHPNICRLLHVYEKGDKVSLVLELCKGELYDRVKKNGSLSEHNSRDAAQQMLEAVAYLHRYLIVHRDLKLENWLYSAGEGPARLKLIDFGFAHRLSSADQELEALCGTIHYVSPEVLAHRYTMQTDMWSTGVVCYTLIIGRMPFNDRKDWKIAQGIRHGDFSRVGRWNDVSADARDFLSRMLVKDPSQRLTAEQALSHAWLSDAPKPGTAPRPTLLDAEAAASDALWRFGQGSHLQRAVLRVLASSLTSQDVRDLEQLFLDLDPSGLGAISAQHFVALLRRCRPEAPAAEVAQLLECLGLEDKQEVSYSSFVAAMLAARVDQHQANVKAMFDTFDVEGTGYLSAGTIRSVFASPNSAPTLQSGLDDSAASCGSGIRQREGLSQIEAETWISEVDYKDNGFVDFAGFLSALGGKLVLAAALHDDQPAVHVFESLRGQPPADSSTSTREPSQDHLYCGSDEIGSPSKELPAELDWSPRVESSWKHSSMPFLVHYWISTATRRTATRRTATLERRETHLRGAGERSKCSSAAVHRNKGSPSKPMSAQYP